MPVNLKRYFQSKIMPMNATKQPNLLTSKGFLILLFIVFLFCAYQLYQSLSYSNALDMDFDLFTVRRIKLILPK